VCAANRPKSEEKSVQLVRGASFRSDFLQNPYFNRIGGMSRDLFVAKFQYTLQIHYFDCAKTNHKM
jgi:hypothetical protein